MFISKNNKASLVFFAIFSLITTIAFQNCGTSKNSNEGSADPNSSPNISGTQNESDPNTTNSSDNTTPATNTDMCNGVSVPCVSGGNNSGSNNNDNVSDSDTGSSVSNLPAEITADPDNSNCWIIHSKKLCFTNINNKTQNITLSYNGLNENNQNYKIKVSLNSARFANLEFNVSQDNKLTLIPRSAPHYCLVNPKANQTGYCDGVQTADAIAQNCTSPVIFYGDFGKGSLLSTPPARACGLAATASDVNISALPGPEIIKAIASSELKISDQKNNCLVSTADNRSVCFTKDGQKELKIIPQDFLMKPNGYYLVHLEAPSGRKGKIRIKVASGVATVAVTSSPYMCFDETKAPCAKIKTSSGKLQNCSPGMFWSGTLINGKSKSLPLDCSTSSQTPK